MDFQIPLPGASMFHNATNATVQGGEFINANRDVIKLVINSGPDVMDTLRNALPDLLAEVQKIQSKSTADGGAGTDVFAKDDYSPPERGPNVTIDDAIPDPSSLLETRSIADRYTRSMLKCLTGYPLYDPQPYSDHSAEYPRKGVRVGDVGVVTKDGTFDFLFNVCPSQHGLINPRNLPSGFTLETFEESETNRKRQIQQKTHLFQNPVSRTKNLFRRTRYTSSNDGGAILELPEGASQEDATCLFPFRRLASRNGEEWYKYTIGTRGRDILNGSLYLVTSCTKCSQWGIAVFDQPCTPRDSLRFVQNKWLFSTPPTKYSWKGSSIFTTKVASSPASNQGHSLNQCVFVQGYRITLRQDIFNNLVNDLLRGPPHASMYSSLQESGNDLTQRREPASRMRGGAGPDPGRRGPVQDTQRRGQAADRVIVHTNFNLPPVHPSDLINSALLRKNPDAKIAVTHDDDWCDLLKDIFKNLEQSQSLDLAMIAQSYCTSTIDEYSCISFEKIPDSGKSLVIAIDIGTTFSGVSYSLLEPGKAPRIQPVTRFSGQKEEKGNSKVPSVVYYDRHGNFIAAGSEADPETNPLLADMDDVRRAEWFKLRLRLPNLASDKRAELEKLWSPPEPAEDEAHDEIEDGVLLDIEGDRESIQEPEPPKREWHFLPVTDDFKKPVQVFADFLRYLFKSTKEYIIETETNLDWTFSWASIERNTYFVLTHPNGWEEGQRSQMREAAVAAGLVNEFVAAERIKFVTEGEANLHFCLDKNPDLRREGNGLLIVDCGGGTIDFSAYSQTEEGSFREIAPPDCLLQGSIFVTSRARNHFKGRFKDSNFFGSDDDIETMAKAFDKANGVKCIFSNPSLPYYVKFGGLRDTDQRFGIVGGKFKLEGAQVARFFEPAVQDIIDGIKDQCSKVKKNSSSIKFILLAGGFGRSNYLYTRLNNYFKPRGIVVLRLDITQLNKAVADGAVSYYLMRMSS